MGKVIAILMLALTAAGAAFSPASPVSIDVERRRFAAGVASNISVGSARMALTPHRPVDASVRLHRKLPWRRDVIGDVYEMRVTPNVVSPQHPATITMPVPGRHEPGSETFVTFRDSQGWATHPAVVDATGTAATAIVPHLSRWAGIDLDLFMKSIRRTLEVLDVRVPKPPCTSASGVTDVAPDADPLAWVCVSDAGGDARTITVSANRGFPLVLRVEGPISMTRRPAGGGLVEELADPMYAARKLLILPPGTSAELRWDGTVDGSVRFESEVVTVFVRTLLALLTSARATAAELAGAVVAAIDCLVGAPRSLSDAWQPCMSAVAGVANLSDLRHSGLRLAGETLGKLLKMLGLAGTLDLLVEKTLRDGDPIVTHLRAPIRKLSPRLVPVPRGERVGAGRTNGTNSTRATQRAGHPTAAHVSVNGCH